MKNLFIRIGLTILLCSTDIAFGQKNNSQEIGFNKNTIYVSVGVSVPADGVAAIGYYERILTQKNRLSSFVKVGVGEYGGWGQGGELILAQYGILLGNKKHHLELGAGPYYYINGDASNKPYLPLTANVGWRVQKPGGKFVFRMGASVLLIGYVGLGVSF